jgi:hypothetical protein
MVDPKPYSPVDPVTGAWAAFKAAHAVPTTDRDDEAEEQRFYAITDSADEILANQSAATLGGIACKLRRVFAATNTDRWPERLAIGEDTPEHRHQLELSDLYARMMWGAIEDLERLTARVEWDQALSTYSAAHAAATRKGLTDTECDALSETDSLSFRKMVVTPAPDMAALKAKMEIGLAHVWGDCHAEPEEVAALLADVSRLSGEA